MNSTIYNELRDKILEAGGGDHDDFVVYDNLQLADVLIAAQGKGYLGISEYGGMIDANQNRISWNLRKPLHEQSDELGLFLHNLICK